MFYFGKVGWKGWGDVGSISFCGVFRVSEVGWEGGDQCSLKLIPF